MIKYKYNNQEHTDVFITDTEVKGGKVIPLNLLSSEDLEGITIEPFKTSEEEVKEARKDANKLHDHIEREFLIEANGRVYNFNPMAVSKFGLKLLSSSAGDVIKWTAYDNIQYEHTLTQAQAIFSAGDTFLYALFAAKQADKEATQNNDFSLSSLKAIKAAQEVLRNQ